MFSQSPLDTVTDLVIDHSAAGPPPWRLSGVLGWTGSAALAAGGVWLAVLAGWQRLLGPAPLDSLLAGGLFGTAVACAAVGGLNGLLVGGAAGLVRGRPPRAIAAVTWGVGFAVAMAVGGGVFPLVVAATVMLVPPAMSSALTWAAVGAVVGAIGYTRSHRLDRPPGFEAGEERGAWRPAGAAGWGVALGVLAAGAWLGELALLRLLPDPVTLGPLLRGKEVALAGPLAALAGGIGLIVGGTFGFAIGTPSRLTAALMRGLGFMAVAAVGGGLFPLVVVTTSDWLAPEVSSALVWAVVCAVAGVLAYTWTRRPLPDEYARFDADEGLAAPAEFVEMRPLSGRATYPRPAEPARVQGGGVDPAEEVPSPVLTSGWDPEPEATTRDGPRYAPPRVSPVGWTVTSGALVRVAPILMVSVVCLLAVGHSATSPVGWAMLGVGLLGLATAAALVGQERRIRKLECRLAGPSR